MDNSELMIPETSYEQRTFCKFFDCNCAELVKYNNLENKRRRTDNGSVTVSLDYHFPTCPHSSRLS